VIALVLGFVVGMDRVTHITGNQERLCNRLPVSPGTRRESFDESWDKGGLGAGGGDAPDLLVVEEGDAVYVSVRFLAVCDGLESAKSQVSRS
jgi:hypothetical protein